MDADWFNNFIHTQQAILNLETRITENSKLVCARFDSFIIYIKGRNQIEQMIEEQSEGAEELKKKRLKLDNTFLEFQEKMSVQYLDFLSQGESMRDQLSAELERMKKLRPPS